MSGASDPKAFSDVSKRAQSTLDYIMSGQGEEKVLHNASQMPVSEALTSEHVLDFESERSQSRILFLSSDPDALQEGSWLQKHVLNLQSVFSEIHVAVVARGKKAVPNKRIGSNIWLYKVQFSSTFFLAQTVTSFAKSQLQFLDGFRPDLIVALDPFYAGVAAQTLSQRFDRPWQVHVLSNFLEPGFVDRQKYNKEKLKLAKKLLKRAPSVRANSSLLKDSLEKTFPKIEDLGVLPRHFDTDAILKDKRGTVLKEKYPQYSFIMLTAAVLDHDNTVFRTIDAARTLLLSPKIALVVVGDGPMKAELQQRAELLGIKEQVIFETNTSLLPSYLLSADLFLCTDTTAIGDEYVIQAAAAGLPMVMAKTPMRTDLFVHETSGLLVEAEDVTAFTQHINTILNTNAYRAQFGTNARLVVKDRLQTDPDLYRIAYRDSVEVIFGKAERSDDEVMTEVVTGTAGNVVNPPEQNPVSAPDPAPAV